MDTREKLVRVAEGLMLRDGYSATRVDDVIRKAGLSKGSFYHFFDSKESLGLAALDHYFADRVGRLAAGTYAAEADPLRRAHGSWTMPPTLRQICGRRGACWAALQPTPLDQVGSFQTHSKSGPVSCGRCLSTSSARLPRQRSPQPTWRISSSSVSRGLSCWHASMTIRPICGAVSNNSEAA